MSTELELVKRAYAAWESKDIEALKGLLHQDYKGIVPGGMVIQGIEGAKECLAQCPMECHSENETYIVDGNKIVRIWDMVGKNTATNSDVRVRMAELNVVQDGKVLLNEAFFDSGAFPKEMQEQFAEMQKKKETAGV